MTKGLGPPWNTQVWLNANASRAVNASYFMQYGGQLFALVAP